MAEPMPPLVSPLFVLVGGWPGSGKTTTARALAPALDLAYLGKDTLKGALMEQFGAPEDVEASRRLGEAAVRILLRLARDCPGAVVDSTWFAYTRALVEELPGRVVEVRCRASLDVVEQRYRARRRSAGHLDELRDAAELWGRPVSPLGVGPLVEVDTEDAVDIAALAARIRAAA